MNFSSLLNLLPHKIVYAHCDIPCGVYDVHQAQMAAHTIIRMTEFLKQIKREDSSIDLGLRETKAEHDITRITHVKEEYSSILEHELVTLRNDYFKEEYFNDYPDLEKLFRSANKLGGKVRQGIDMDSANELLEVVMQIAEIFYKSKSLECTRVKSPYPTELDIVVQK